MYGRRRRRPVLGTALLIGATTSVARNSQDRQQMAMEQARLSEATRRLEYDRQMQMQAMQTEEAVRRGIASAETQRRLSEQSAPQGYQNGPPVYQNAPPVYQNSPPVNQSNQQSMQCNQCKQMNQSASRFCSNCGNKLQM